MGSQPTVPDVAGATLPPVRAPLVSTRAAVASAPAAEPQETVLKVPSTPNVAAPAAVHPPVSAPAASGSARWIVASIAFLVGVATPIALVKSGVVSAHAAKR